MQPSEKALRDAAASIEQVAQAVARRVVGQQRVVELMLITLVAGGHALLVGLPGLAKTLVVRALAATGSLTFRRVQFTPDLMPQDITGGDVLDGVSGGAGTTFRFLPGPVFCNLLLADEINRTPPKTQAALLQAMQEREVTCGATTYPLAAPFHVFATQNPMEQEGTYPLPEAQLDRFMARIAVDYPSADEEVEILRRDGAPDAPSRGAAGQEALGGARLVHLQALARQVPIADALLGEAADLIRRTRPNAAYAPASVRRYVRHGAGPRAAVHWLRACRARALVSGRPVVDRSDLHALAGPVLGHRLGLRYAAEADGVAADALLAEVIAGAGG